MKFFKRSYLFLVCIICIGIQPTQAQKFSPEVIFYQEMKYGDNFMERMPEIKDSSISVQSKIQSTRLAVNTYKVEQGSFENKIEIAMAGNLKVDETIYAEIIQSPTWVNFSESVITTNLSEKVVRFSFSINQQGSQGDQGLVEIRFKDETGNTWNKHLEIELITPAVFKLSQNYPNPFNPVTTIGYNLPEQAKVVLVVYNLLGQKVQTLVEETQKAGSYKVKWDGSDVASGFYLFRIEAISRSEKTFIKHQKMLLIK